MYLGLGNALAPDLGLEHLDIERAARVFEVRLNDVIVEQFQLIQFVRLNALLLDKALGLDQHSVGFVHAREELEDVLAVERLSRGQEVCDGVVA